MRDSKEFFDQLKRKGFQPKTVLDVGVAHGTESLYGAFPDAFYFLFEPVAEFEKTIRWLLTRIHGEYWPCALSDKAGTAKLFMAKQADGASLMHREPEGDPRLRPVDVRTLDDIFARREVEAPVLLKTDCQGADLNVIKGGRRFIQQCDMIIMEVGMFHYWGPQTPDFTDVVRYLAGEGFVAFDFIGYLPRPLDGALGQVDVVFVKQEGRFRSIHRWL